VKNRRSAERRELRIYAKESINMKILMFGNDYFGSIRVVLLQDEPWFVAKDICDILGFSENIEFLLDEEETGSIAIPTETGHRIMAIISKYGLYCLMMSSRNSEVKKFKRWINKEVLPASYEKGNLKAKTMKLEHQLLLTQEELRKAKITIQSQKKFIQVAWEEIELARNNQEETLEETMEETLEEKKHRILKEISEVIEEQDMKLRELAPPLK